MITILEDRRIKNMIRLVAIALTLSFILQDIAWAYPDKLATQSFFTIGKSARERAYARYIDGLIEKSGISKEGITLAALKAIVKKHQEEAWFKNNISYRESEDDLQIRFPSGYTIRYYEKDKNGKLLTELLPPKDDIDV